MRNLTLIAIATLLAAPAAAAQRPVDVAPNAPRDKPVNTYMACVRDSMYSAMKPYVAQARATYPAARDRFNAGLPPRHTFFVTTRLRDTSGREEQVFIAVDSIRDGRIAGRIWSQIEVVSGYHLRQPYTFPESELLDWMVARPDGTEEGNVVGKFLDTYTPPAVCGNFPHVH